MPSLETKAPLEETLQLQGEDERDIIDSPSSLPHSTRSSLRSSRSDLVLPISRSKGLAKVTQVAYRTITNLSRLHASRPETPTAQPHRSRDLWLRLLRHREDQPAHRLVIVLFPVRTLQRHFRASSDLVRSQRRRTYHYGWTQCDARHHLGHAVDFLEQSQGEHGRQRI